jgi:3'-5' exonuclease
MKKSGDGRTRKNIATISPGHSIEPCHEANRDRVGPGDCARPSRVRGRQRSGRKSDVEVREALGDKFPKHIYHSIVCIGALIAHWELDHWVVDAVGAPHVGERTEKQLIAAFCDKIAELSPRLVTFNGHSFDLPVLRYRAMVHGVSAAGLSARPYFYRFSEDAIDLCDALSSLGSTLTTD